VEKSPYNEYYADQIFAWWPEARCIHIIRDPRDNYVSYRRKHPAWSAEFFASNWKRSTQAGVDNRNRYSPDRYLILRYEDLVGSPGDSLRQLVDFLQIDWNPRWRRPHAPASNGRATRCLPTSSRASALRPWRAGKRIFRFKMLQ